MNKRLKNQLSKYKLQAKAKKLADLHTGTAFDLIGGKLLEVSPSEVKAQFVLNEISRQVFGLMHGGIYAYVAESIASLGAWMSVDQEKTLCLGTEINATHLKAFADRSSKINAYARCLKAGKNMQIWSIEFTDKNKDLLSIARCSVFLKHLDSKHKSNKSLKTRKAK